MTQDDLVKAAELYARHKGLAISTLGRIVAADGKFFIRLAADGSCTMRTGEQVAQWFSENWPDDLEWPRGVSRPKPSRVPA
jgi:hypothetical protein